jgi:hypothetical protein
MATTDSVTAKVQGVVRERRSLLKRLATARKHGDRLRERVTAIDRECEHLEGRIGEIDEALRPLDRLAPASGGPRLATPAAVTPKQAAARVGAVGRMAAARRAKREGHPTNMDRVVEAIGRRGLDDFSARDIAMETGIGNVGTYLSELFRAGKLHKMSTGHYRVMQGRIAA